MRLASAVVGEDLRCEGRVGIGGGIVDLDAERRRRAAARAPRLAQHLAALDSPRRIRVARGGGGGVGAVKRVVVRPLRNGLPIGRLPRPLPPPQARPPMCPPPPPKGLPAPT